MGNIVVLDELTINKIAAGEVIERPANVVKELVENSIDAGATNIEIEIKNGGKKYIRITDNGKGIERDDLLVAIERHATSKIRKVEDLEKTYTMGFRGEALASITAISKTTIISKTKEEQNGNKLVAEAGNIIQFEDFTSREGTSIIVENLFFNTPVRYKFLKQDATEFKYIKDILQKIAIANLNISFKLINNGSVVLKTNGSGKIRDVIYLIYGKDISENLVDINYSDGLIKITGVVGNTFIARDSRKDQIIYLNKRNIKNKLLFNSADEAFKGGIGIGKYGFYILNIDMPANFYDVNVHPTKTEVRFKEEEKIYKIIYHALKNAMLNKSFLGNNEIEEEKENYINSEYKYTTENFVKTEDNENIIENREIIKRDKKRKIKYKYLGISFRTFITAEIDDNIYLIDQHAAHERVLYEQIRENYKITKANNTQMLLIPDVITLTHKEMQFVKEHFDLFKKTGFEIELFGENTVKVIGRPDISYKLENNNMFLDILDTMLTNERNNIKDTEDRFIATVACKAAVKANMDLSKEEVDNLIEDLLNLKNPYTCPHGRPTTIKISKNELIKKLS
jgi:DNA mismatch repair protein MutL